MQDLYQSVNAGGVVFAIAQAGAVAFVGAGALAGAIAFAVLNACYSFVQASALAQHIPYVIGMKQAIGDKAAIKFATGFYNLLYSAASRARSRLIIQSYMRIYFENLETISRI